MHDMDAISHAYMRGNLRTFAKGVQEIRELQEICKKQLVTSAVLQATQKDTKHVLNHRSYAKMGSRGGNYL